VYDKLAWRSLELALYCLIIGGGSDKKSDASAEP